MKFDDQGWLDVAQGYDISANSWERGGVKISHLVLHGTAGGSDGRGTMAYMGSAGVSTHFAISTDGTIVQGIPCSRVAWANAPLNEPRLSFARSDINPNFWTVSIEFCKPDTTNGINITDAQKKSGFALINAVCEAYGIPKRAGNGTSGIISHADINSVDRARCPGTFPWDDLWAFLKAGGKMGLPQGWSDNGTTLTYGPFKVVAGFRKLVLAGLQDGTWGGDNVPVENEHAASPLEYSNTALKPGNKQRFLYSTLEWNQDKGVFVAYTGPELMKLELLLATQKSQIDILTQQVASLKTQNSALINSSVQLQDLHKIYLITSGYEATK